MLLKYNIWHHIDACVSGVALFSNKYRHLTSSFKHANSVTIDCHKCLNLNQQCSLLLVREGGLLGDVSRITAPYLFHKDSEHDIANRYIGTLEKLKFIFCNVFLKTTVKLLGGSVCLKNPH